MSDSNGTSKEIADIRAKLQEMMASYEVLFNSQESLLTGYHALYEAIRVIVEANTKRRFLDDELKQSLLRSLDISKDSLNTYFDAIQKAKGQ